MTNASINSSGAHSPRGKLGAFAHVVSPGGGAFAILSRPRGLGISIPRGDPGHLTHVFFDTKAFVKAWLVHQRLEKLVVVF